MTVKGSLIVKDVVTIFFLKASKESTVGSDGVEFMYSVSGVAVWESSAKTLSPLILKIKVKETTAEIKKTRFLPEKPRPFLKFTLIFSASFSDTVGLGSCTGIPSFFIIEMISTDEIPSSSASL